MALDLRPNGGRCDRDLPPRAADARICIDECTFCADRADGPPPNVCPNRGGFAARPIRPATAWRPGVSLADHPASGTRARLRHAPDDVAAHLARIAAIRPEDR